MYLKATVSVSRLAPYSQHEGGVVRMCAPFHSKHKGFNECPYSTSKMYRNLGNFRITHFCAFHFVVIYYLQFQEAVSIDRNKNYFYLKFRVFNFCSLFQPRIINIHESFQNYGSLSLS